MTIDETGDGARYLNDGEYGSLSQDAKNCIALAQSEMLAVSVMVYQITPDFDGAIKGNIAAVGRENVAQEVDPRFTPNPDIPYLVLHKKSLLDKEVKPGDEVIIRYVDGSARVTSSSKDANFAYEINVENEELSKRIAEFLAKASENCKNGLMPNKIAEVVGNATTNFYATDYKDKGRLPETITLDITRSVKTINLEKEAIKTSLKFLNSYKKFYREDLQGSEKKEHTVFIGNPIEVRKRLLGMRMRG